MIISLKAARVNAGLSQIEAAKRLNISNNTLCKYEKGLSFPNITTIRNMESLYKIEYKDIYFLPTSTFKQ